MNNDSRIELVQAQTDILYEPPQESLKVISNYSSLQRMYQKTTPAKNGLQKKDSFTIAGWESHSKDKRLPVKSRSRFRKEGEKVHLTIATERISRGDSRKKQSIVSCRDQTVMGSPKRVRQRSLPQGTKQLILGTNFKYGVKHNFIQKQQWTTFSPLPVSPRSRSLKEKAKIAQIYKKETQLRRDKRGAWPYNPECDYLPTTFYPIISEGTQLGHRRKRQAFLKHFGL